MIESVIHEGWDQWQKDLAAGLLANLEGQDLDEHDLNLARNVIAHFVGYSHFLECCSVQASSVANKTAVIKTIVKDNGDGTFEWGEIERPLQNIVKMHRKLVLTDKLNKLFEGVDVYGGDEEVNHHFRLWVRNKIIEAFEGVSLGRLYSKAGVHLEGLTYEQGQNLEESLGMSVDHIIDEVAACGRGNPNRIITGADISAAIARLPNFQRSDEVFGASTRLYRRGHLNPGLQDQETVFHASCLLPDQVIALRRAGHESPMSVGIVSLFPVLEFGFVMGHSSLCRKARIRAV